MSKFVPQNLLEEAILKNNMKLLIQAVAENHKLSSAIAAKYLDSNAFSDEAICCVLLLASNITWFLKHCSDSERIQTLAADIISAPQENMQENEKALAQAVAKYDSSEVIRLIQNENVKLNNIAPEIPKAVPELTREAAAAFLKHGLTAKAQAQVLGVLLNEAENPELFKDISYSERIKYANLMIHIISGEDISAQKPWYPEKSDGSFFYYYDPEHKFNPYK